VVVTQRLVFVLHRRPDMTREAFQEYWSTTHAPLVVSVADVLGITGYQQVHTIREDPTRPARAFDGVAELWFDPSRSTASREEQQAAGALLLEDERRFIDLASSPIWMADEHVVLDGPRSGLRMTSAVRRKAGTSRDEFRRHWAQVHAPIALARPDVFGIVRYVQAHTPDDAEGFPPAAVRGAPAPFDGLAEVYLTAVESDPDDAATVRAAIAADTDSFIDRAASPNCFGRVDVIIDR
jgi:uncharacterized protein (TIGR02118 family)